MKTGDIIHINNHPYTLGSCIGEGAEGQVFALIERPKAVVKIINDSKFTAEQRESYIHHFTWLMNVGADQSGNLPKLSRYMSLPLALCTDCLGYVMHNAVNYESLNNYLDRPDDDNDFIEWFKGQYSLRRRYKLIINIFDTLRVLHTKGLVFTDLSPNNIMVSKDKNSTYFIDTDNIKLKTDLFASVQGTVGYMAPELYKSFNEGEKIYGKITADTDIFSAAVIAFQLLTLNHPFIGDEIDEGPAELEEEALEIKKDYIFKKGTTNVSTKEFCPFFEKFTTPEIRSLFYRTFVDSVENPNLRPTDVEFIEAFQKGLDMIYVCPKCGFSSIYLPKVQNTCVGCDEIIPEQINFVVYAKYVDLTPAEIINSSITSDDNTLNVDDNYSLDKGFDYDTEISRMIIQPNGKDLVNAKNIHLRHLEELVGRSRLCGTIQLDENETDVIVSIDTKVPTLENVKLVDAFNSNIIKKEFKNNGLAFKYTNESILFKIVKQGKGSLKVVGEFKKE